ncbi:T-cell surface antigen CD2 isoform X2 [Scomber scombrus]|uniref:T-cell surface antigen CD2 isoform X2 n=1 Tax=Scomber scombrus TaxID=13677 RepID=A0AAV1PYR7_SCOSC
MRMMMKMAAVALLMLLLCGFVVTEPECDETVAVGQDFTVPLKHTLQDTDTLQWKHGDTVIFRQKKKEILTGKVDDIDKKGSLKLTKLQQGNAGKYTAEVNDVSGIAVKNLKPFNLCVRERVPEPSLGFTCSEDFVIFTCKVKITQDQQKDIKYSWLMEKQLMKESTNILKKNPEEVKGSVRCNVYNEAMSLTSKPVIHDCKPKLFGLDFWLMVAILAGGGGLVLVLIITVIVCCCRAGRKKSMRVKDEEELRLGWSKPEHHHHHHGHGQHDHPPGHNHTHHHHQQPAGHTGPRQPRSKQHREPRGKLPEPPNGQPQPSPRRPAQAPRPVNNMDDEHPPPLPQPRKKAPKTPRV